MVLDFEDAARLHHYADRRTGMLEFRCELLGAFEGAEASLEGPLRAQFLERGQQEHKQSTKIIDRLIGALSGDTGDGIQVAHARQSADLFWQNTRTLFLQSGFRRAVADLTDREVATLKAASAQALAAQHDETMHEEMLRFLFQLNTKLVWAGGRGQVVPSEQADKFPAEAHAAADLAREMMRRHVNDDTASYEQEIGLMLGQYVEAAQHPLFSEKHPQMAAAIAGALDQVSTAWATPQHIKDGQTPFKPYIGGRELFLGYMDRGGYPYEVGFAGAESLVTVAQPGSGKTQCHILPNLLAYDGSIVALDPKLELLELSAGCRQSEGKRILVMNLADDDQPTHRFNVMEFIDTRPEFMWGGLVELAEFLLPAASHDNNPIFRNKAVEMFAVCLGGVLLEAKQDGSVPTLSRAVSQVFKSPESLKNYFYDTETRACDAGCAPLEESAASLAALAKQEGTLEDFVRYQSNATSVLTKYRGGVIDRVAAGPGDWRPEDLRETGTTLYIRIPYEEMGIYGGFVRMVLYTIIKRLRKGPTEQDDLPITFLLDEAGQLGDLDQIANVIETGRGFGLRVWMILQDYDQAKAASRKPNLILRTPKVRLFMNPTLETAQDMSAELGKINQVITGQDKPMAEPAYLMGESYANDMVVLSSGSRPLRLTKSFAWQIPNYEILTTLPYQFTQNGYQPITET